MSFIGIIASQKQAEQIKKDIKNLKVEIISINTKSIENIKNIKFDILIIYDTFKKLEGKEKYIQEILKNSKYLLLNTDIDMEKEILEGINVNIITYGLNQKATITASSIGENEIIICVQRAFKDINNKIIEQNEVRRKLRGNNTKDIYNSLIKETIINICGSENRKKFH